MRHWLTFLFALLAGSALADIPRITSSSANRFTNTLANQTLSTAQDFSSMAANIPWFQGLFFEWINQAPMNSWPKVSCGCAIAQAKRGRYYH